MLQCLIDAPAEALRNSEWAPVMEFADFPWVPVVDGDFLTEQPTASLKRGNFKVAELLIGSNLEEAIYFIVYQLGVSSEKIFIFARIFLKMISCCYQAMI